MKYKGEATRNSVKFYQSKTGLVQYPATVTRADIAYITLRLAEFLLNPRPAYHKAADHYIRYLLGIKNLAICFLVAIEDSLTYISDTLFGDYVSNRKSSQGYIIKLFGGLIL